MEIRRHKTREVPIGNRMIGGDNPILIQSMTNTDTRDVQATVRQIKDLEAAGCDIVQVAVPDMGSESHRGPKKTDLFPLVADIHLIMSWRWRP